MKRIKILTLALGILFSLHTAVFADKNYRIVLEKGDYYLRFPGYSSCDYEVSDAMGNYYHWDSVTRLYKKGRALAVLDLLKKSGSINLSGERLAIPLPNRNNFVSQTQDELRLQLTLWTADKNDIRNIMGTKLSINHTIEWWPGESAFFNLVRTTNSSDKDKIMSMLYAYFNDKGEGVNFQNMISAEYSEANNIHLFDTIDAEKKKKALDSLADM
ncbi:MAG: hypothetical protein LBM77_03420, partial [Spirochaetaceae bacterium]|nr:hypothetical protein [Spirochaetaceae bacterium]